MLRSKSIQDYFEVDFGVLRPDEIVPFDTHLYFSGTDHVIIWRRADEMLSQTQITQYKSRDIRKIWIHKEDQALFDAYMAGPTPIAIEIPTVKEVSSETSAPVSNEPPAIVPIPEPTPLPTSAPDVYNSENMKKILSDETLDESLRRQNVITAATQLLNPFNPQNLKKEVRELIGSDSENDATDQLLDLSNDVPELAHSVDVSTYAVLIAMLCGTFRKSRLRELAIAALAHDIGLCFVNPECLKKPWDQFSESENAEYILHVKAGVEWLKKWAPEVSEGARTLIENHHEKFDGSGYPNQTKGFALDDLSQFLSVADLIVSVGSGRADGQAYTFRDSIELVAKLQHQGNVPEYFNPEVFNAVQKYIRNPTENFKEESQKIMAQGQKILKSAA